MGGAAAGARHDDRWAGSSATGISASTGPRLFDRAGNVGPTVWWDGRVVGGWAQDADGEIVCRFLEDAGSAAVAATKAAAERLAAVLGEVRLTARTRGLTWLEDELARPA